MKTNVLIAIFGLLFSVNSSAKDLKSTITDVIVFLDGAQVTRNAPFTIPAGETELVVNDLTPLLKKESIQVTGKGDFTILSISHRMNYLEKERSDNDIKLLESRQQKLEWKIEEINTRISVLRAEESLVSGLGTVSSAQKELNVEAVKMARDLYHLTLTEIKLENMKLSREVRESREELNFVTQQLKAIATPHTTASSDIVVKLSAKESTTAALKVSYIVKGARWFPTYDVRVKNVESPLIIDYKANVSQQTGEDWKNVNLTLSTSDPRKTSVKPKLNPWYLKLNHRPAPAYSKPTPGYTSNPYGKVSGKITDQYGEPLPFANIVVLGTTVGTISDVDGDYELVLPPNARQIQVSFVGYNASTQNVNGTVMNFVLEEAQLRLEEVVIVENASESRSPQSSVVRYHPSSASEIAFYSSESKSNRLISRPKKQKIRATPSVPVQVSREENVVSTDFKIKDRYSIPSDARSYTVTIGQIKNEVHFQYYCAPKLDKDVFLTAELTDWGKHNLLEGQANIFVEGTFTGRSLMDVRFVSDTLQISLGRDKGIVVKREKVKEFKKRRLIGSDIAETRKWKIDVRNTKSQSINIIVEDQFPITNNSEITVSQDEKSGGKVDPETSIITWDFKLDKGDAKTVDFKYTVRYPKGNFLALE